MADPERPTEPLPPLEEPSGAVDEIGVQIGPDEGGGGLFERSASEVTGTSETTAGQAVSVPVARRRTAILAWIAADLPEPGLSESAEATRPRVDVPWTDTVEGPAPEDGEGVPCEALRRRILEEALDPLPAIDAADPGTPEEEASATLPAPVDGAEPTPSPAPSRLPEALRVDFPFAAAPPVVDRDAPTSPGIYPAPELPAPAPPAPPSAPAAEAPTAAEPRSAPRLVAASPRPTSPPATSRPPDPFANGLAGLTVLILAALAAVYFLFR